MVNEQMLVTLTVGQLRQLIKEELNNELEKRSPKQVIEQDENDCTMTIEDVAKYLNCTKATVHNHIKKGWLPKPIRIGRKVLWQSSTIKHIER